ncbi:MAG: outer membrane protein assembly factor BamB family protein [Gaiellaceae bacterium]
MLGIAAVTLTAAGCSSAQTAKVLAPVPVAKAPIQHRPAGAVVVVTVVDGDTHARVRGAVVRLGERRGVSDRHGVARIRVRHRRGAVVSVRRAGYTPLRRRLPFQRQRAVTVRIYQPRLQWTMYGANPARTQSPTGIRLRPPFRIGWSLGLHGLLEFPAVIANGVAYIGNASGTVRAIDVAEGTVLWRHRTPGGKMASSPAVIGDLLVVHGMDGHVWVLDRATGRLRWRYTIGSPIESSPIVAGGVDYFGAWNGAVYALDLARRRLRWTLSTGAKITSSASIADGTLYIGNYAGRLLALDPRSGHQRWQGTVNGRIYGTPAVGGGRVFVPSSDGGSLTAFSIHGRQLWRIDTGSYVYSSPAVWAGRVFFGSYNGLLYCVSASSGSILWTAGAGGAISGAAVVVDGIVYAGSFAHRIIGVDAHSGRVRVRFPHGDYVPVSANGGIMLFHGYSRIYAAVPVERTR